MDELSFIVQASNDTPHCTVTVRKDAEALTAHCTCASGGSDTVCKHRISILSGQKKWVISNNLSGVELVRSWVVSTKVGPALIRLVRIQQRLQEARSELDQIAKSLKAAGEIVERAETEANMAKERLIQIIK